MTTSIMRGLALGALAVVLFGGCSKPAEMPATATAEPAAKSDPQAEIEKELASLSPADRELVLAQKICPVSGGALGGMGAPIKVTVEGRDVFICCEHCEKPLKEDPAKYLAKLDAAKGDAPAAEKDASATP